MSGDRLRCRNASVTWHRWRGKGSRSNRCSCCNCDVCSMGRWSGIERRSVGETIGEPTAEAGTDRDMLLFVGGII